MTTNIFSEDTDKHFDNSASSAKVNNRNEDNNISSRQEEALYYHSLNFNVIPIPKPGEKIAQVWSEEKQAFFDEIADGKSAKGYGSWNEWQSKQQTPEDVTKLFQDKKDCNITILTGIISRIIVFDIDSDEAEKHFDKLVESLGDTEIENVIKNTMQTKSGSGQGKHVVLRFNPKDFQNGQEIKTTTLWIGEGKHSEIKIKAEGGYIIVPSSLHASGDRYKFINKVEPGILTREQILKLISAFNSKASDGCDNNITEKEDKYPLYKNLTDEKIEYILSRLKDYFYKGQRDEIIFGFAGLLFKSKVSLSSAKNLVTILCNSTLDEQKNNRLEVLESTYLNGLNGKEITGSSHLVEILARTISGNNNNADNITSADKIVKDIIEVLNDDDNNKQNEEANNKNNDFDLNAAQSIIKLAKENASLFFNDQYNIAYAKVKVENHEEVIALESSKFEYYLSKLYYYHTVGKVANQESLNNAIRLLLAETHFNTSSKVLNLRVAWGEIKGKEIYIDLTDSKWRCIKLTDKNWEIVQQNCPVLFTRFNQKAQVLPDRNYPQNIFDDFLDLMHIHDSGHRLLTKVWITFLLIPEFPHPIKEPYGEKGSSKSTYCRFVKRLVDPDKIELLTIPQEKREFVQQLYHNYLAIYDNVKHLPPWFSDEACKAVTGVGNSKRILFTNDEDIIYNYKRCLMINGINNSLTEPDALDRSILIEFARILPEQRKEESEVEAQFEEMRPKLFAYLLDILVRTLQIKSTIKLSNLPRMADFTVWGEAIARAMGYKPMQFVDAYNENIGRQNVEAIETNPLAQAIEKLVDSWYKQGNEACWQSPMSILLEKLNKIATTYNIDTSSKLWPKAANVLTKRLRPILSNLREGLGINIEIGRQTTGNKKNTSTIRIEKVSPLPPPSPPEEIHAQNEDKIGGGTSEGGDNISTEQQIPPPEIIQNHAQKSESGGSGHSGGIISTLEGGELLHFSPLPTTYVAFDFEWLLSPTIAQPASSIESVDIDTQTQLTVAAFVNNQGNSKVLHISDFSNSDNPECELLVSINQELMKYDFSIGWYSTGVAKYHEDTQEYLDGVDSDLALLHNRCLANDVDPIVDFTGTGIPYIRGQKHIDLHSVFSKPMVQTTIFKNAYRTLKLDEVSKAILLSSDSTGTGKYKGLTGKDIYKLSVQEQKEYVLKDAQLVMQLSKHNNGEVLDAMKTISKLTGLDFERVCRTGISTWWAAIFDNMILNGECQAPALSYDRQEQVQTELAYTGGIVLQPKKGLYHNLIVVDVASLYPTMAVLHNISFDTVKCECCKDNPEFKTNKDITKDCKMEKDYWICKQKEGAFPKKLKVFKEERLKQKKLGNQVKQIALKILINGGYGVFGGRYFKYYDPRVAELITAYGRQTLTKMQQIAKNMDFEIVYGDTDSLFLNYNNYDSSFDKNTEEVISEFREECNRQLGVEVEHSKTYKTAIITDKKKHYVGWTGVQEKEPDVVGMEGDKSDRPKWVNNVFRKTVYDIVVHNTDPIINLKKAIYDLEHGNVNPELLKRSNRLSKNPEEYENENDRKRKIGLAIGARKGDVIEYFESDNDNEGYSLNSQDISIRKYKIMLWKTIKDVLEITGYDIETIEQELILNTHDHTARPPRTAWSGNANLLGGEQ
jgi:DNA polymerase elongation subunit (family B)